MKCAVGWASFSACSSGEIAHEAGDLNHGVFTHFLCEGLAGKARNQQGDITIESLVDYVKTSVANWCERQTLQQTPHFQSDLSGSLVLGASLPEPCSEALPLGSPFGELIVGIEKHLTSSAEDARRLTFTDDTELRGIADAFHRQLTSMVANFSHPAIVVSLGHQQPLHTFGPTPWHACVKDVKSSGVDAEFTSQTMACEVDFRSSEILIPSTSRLYIRTS
jgi:hypothetical protein